MNFNFDLQRFASSSDNAMLGAGILYFDRKAADGSYAGERDLGHCSAFTTNTTVEKIEKYSNRTGARRLWLSVPKQVNSAGKITLDEFDPVNLALAVLGEDSVIKQEAKTDCTATFSAVQDRYFRLGDYRDVKEVVVKSGASPDEKTYAENTDYLVEPETGRIYIIPDGGIKDNTEVTATFSVEEKSYPVITAGITPVVEGRLRFVGDPTTGPRYELEAWNVNLTPDGDLAWITDDLSNFSINVAIMDDSKNHPKEPLYRLIQF